MTTTTALPKQYDPSEVEPRWFRFWNENGFFHADETSPTVPYSITLPPPNVTGSLHMGHALGSTLQDVLIRWKRMAGFNAMWMPGTDHASIAVHVLLEKDLARKEKKNRFDLGRDEFMRRAWAWKERSGNRISEQEKLMGFSLDWQRERFTMDEKSNRAVTDAFVRLHEEGLIFRAKRMINWDYASQTVVSDLEVDTVEESGSLWEIRYPVVGGGGEIVVATTRPETMLGDTAVAVHPSDERYKHLHGKQVELPLTGRTIPIIAIEIIRDGKPWPDPAFGSGAVKVTPAHDPNDYEAGLEAKLPVLQVIGFDGTMIDPAPAKYVGMSVDAARKEVVADLEEGGFLVGTKPYKVPRGRSQRSQVVIEPMLMEQWFVKAKPLAEKAIAAVETGKTKFVPEQHHKVFMNWMTNIQDWCISRQLWWGHRIPAWHCAACKHITVARAAPAGCAKCNGAVTQDEDILDTWFSSALWPFSTLGWPDKTRDLATFYPNNVLVTGPDIIFFWVARMMMFGLHFMGKVPFRTVYLTAIVTDEEGDKMSKTKGNVIDPLDVVYGASLDTLLERVDIEKPPVDPDVLKRTIRKNFSKGIPPMGSDALRFTLSRLNTGDRIRLSVERVEENRNFINKLWNASRFALMNLDGYDPERFESQIITRAGRAAFGMPERWILSRLQSACTEVDGALEAFQFSKAANGLYHFIYDELCDWYIELAKPSLHYGQPAGPGPELGMDSAKAARRHVTQGVLATVLETTLRLMHPFSPYVTEEIWQKLPKPPQLPGSLMITVFPRADQAWIDPTAETEMAIVQETAIACRMLKQTYNVPPTQRTEVLIRVTDEQARPEGAFAHNVLTQHLDKIDLTAKVTAKLSSDTAPVPGAAKAIVRSNLEVIMPLGGLIDVDAEKARIKKDLAKAEKEIATIERKLENPDFIAKAKEGVVDEQRARLSEEQSRRQRLVDALETLGASR